MSEVLFLSYMPYLALGLGAAHLRTPPPPPHTVQEAG